MRSPQETAKLLVENVGKVLVGKEAAVELALVALGCEGHVLMDDIPGVGKTMLARALSISLGLSFRRIQCTPDLLPSDITGLSVYDPKKAKFTFRPGPVMTNLVLMDEINRATPRTQSSMLEAMEERQVTVDGETRTLQRPFMVIATQNPVEFEGTFPLPEAQLDRFLLRLSLGYPTRENELEILTRLENEHPIIHIQPVVEIEDIFEFIQAKRRVFIEKSLREYLLEMVERTRRHPDLDLGVSPRGTIALFNAARVWAAIKGREFVIPEDIRFLAPHILSHRVVVSASAAVKGRDGLMVIQEITDGTPIPTEAAFHG